MGERSLQNGVPWAVLGRKAASWSAGVGKAMVKKRWQVQTGKGLCRELSIHPVFIRPVKW